MTAVEEVDTAAQVIYTPLGTLSYDYLVLAIGAETNFFGNQHIAEKAIPMKSVSEALYLRNTLLNDFEKALSTVDEDARKGLLNMVIVGGGPTGVEVSGALAEMRKYILKKDYPELDTDRANGCIRDKAHAYSQDGGLAVLHGNIARDGCIVKTAGVDADILRFTGKARIFESQEDAVDGILGGAVKPGDVVFVRYEGPKGGPGMQEMLYPTSYLKSKGLGKVCALVTDGRFSGGSSGLCIGHVSPEAAEGGAIGLVEDGDTIEIDIPSRRIHLAVTDAELEKRRKAMDAKGAAAWKPRSRDRVVTPALRAYAALTTSAATGAVRNVSQVEK